MRYKPLIYKLLVWSFGLLGSIAPIAFAEAISPQEALQVYASRVTGSLMLLRGEGFQKKHQNALETDLQTLAAAVQSLPQSSDALRNAHLELVVQIRRGVSFGPKEEDMPWRYPEDLSKALLAVLLEARKLAPADDSELAAQIEFLAVQYLSRSYFGNFEIARELPDTYLGQDERKLIPKIDNELATLNAKANPALGSLLTRWEYLKSALSDLNSQSNTLQSASGRPFAPITVHRHSRSFTEEWMTL